MEGKNPYQNDFSTSTSFSSAAVCSDLLGLVVLDVALLPYVMETRSTYFLRDWLFYDICKYYYYVMILFNVILTEFR